MHTDLAQKLKEYHSVRCTDFETMMRAISNKTSLTYHELMRISEDVELRDTPPLDFLCSRRYLRMLR